MSKTEDVFALPKVARWLVAGLELSLDIWAQNPLGPDLFQTTYNIFSKVLSGVQNV